MIATFSSTAGDVAAAVVLVVLLLPIGLAARHWAAARHDPVQGAAAGLAAACALLVAGGFALALFAEVSVGGWIALLLVVDLVLLALLRPGWRVSFGVLPSLLVVTALGLVVAAIAMSRESATDHHREARFTQLWMVPRGTGPAAFAEVGVRNLEEARTSYVLRVRGERELILTRGIQLDPSGTWTGRVPVPLTSRRKRITAELFRLGEPRPYRTVHTWTRLAPRVAP